MKPGDGALRAGVQARSRRGQQGDGCRDTPSLEPGALGPPLLQTDKDNVVWQGSQTSPRVGSKVTTGAQKLQEGACGQRERERLNRDCKDTRNSSHSSNVQANRQMKTLVQSVDLRDQVGFRGPVLGLGTCSAN